MWRPAGRVERVDNYVYLRMKKVSLFIPTFAELKEGSYEILSLVADIIKETHNEGYKIEICGHTAWVESDEISANFNSWELFFSALTYGYEIFCRRVRNAEKQNGTFRILSSTNRIQKGETEEEKSHDKGEWKSGCPAS